MTNHIDIARHHLRSWPKDTFTPHELAEAMNIQVAQVYQIIYALRKGNEVVDVGHIETKGRAIPVLKVLKLKKNPSRKEFEAYIWSNVWPDLKVMDSIGVPRVHVAFEKEE